MLYSSDPLSSALPSMRMRTDGFLCSASTFWSSKRIPSSEIVDWSNWKYTGVVIAPLSEASDFLASSRSLAARSASAWSFAFSRSAASLAAADGDEAVDGATATLCREHALLRAATDNKEIESMVLLRMCPQCL